MYDDIKSYNVNMTCLEKEAMWYLGIVYTAGQRSEFTRFYDVLMVSLPI